MAGVSPEIVFFGIEPEDMSSWGTELTTTIQAKIPRLVELVLQELCDSGIESQPAVD